MSLLDALLLDACRVNVWIAARNDGIKGSGTISDPYNANDSATFDALMDSFPEYTHVNLGPGEFQTAGYSDAAPTAGWQPKRGMKIVGSGIDVTTIKLVGAAQSQQHFAIGHALGESGTLADFFEVSDLTIDCNLAGQASSTVACGAVRVMGTHSRVRRIKVINWGTKSNMLCYVIAAITAHPGADPRGVFDTIIDDCVAIQPGQNAGTVVVLHLGDPAIGAVYPEPSGESGIIKNCFVDCGQTDFATDTRAFRALSTSWCHGAIVEGNQIHNVLFGGPVQTSVSVPEAIVRNNNYRNVFSGPHFEMGKLGPAPGASVTFAAAGGVVTVTAAAEHLLEIGDVVRVVDAGSNVQFVKIKDVLSATSFTFAGSVSGSSGTIRKVLGLRKLLVEGNTIELAITDPGSAPVGVKISPDASVLEGAPFPHDQAIIRDNRIRYVNTLMDQAYTGYGTQVSGVAEAIVRNNVLELAPANPLKDSSCGAVSYFNNTDPGGMLIRGYNTTTNLKYDELEVEAEDALLLALIRRN